MFTTIKSSLFTAFRTFGRLAVGDHRTRLRFFAYFHSDRFADETIELFPHSILAKQPKVMIDRLPGRKIVWQRTPNTAILHHIKHGVQQPSPAMLTWCTGRTRLRQVWRNLGPFGIIQIGRVSLL